MRTPSTLVAATVLLLAAACGSPGQADGGSTSTGGQALEQAAPAQETVGFGAQHRFSDGVTFVVSTPKSFRPSSGAYPRSRRAVAFEISIRNDGTQPYQLSGLAVSATVDGIMAKQLVDATQGYSGIADADKDVPPGRHTQILLAFAVPEEPAPMRLTVRPAKTSPVVAVFSGTA